MINQLSVPALAPNQRLDDWAKIYKTATAGLDTEKRKVDYLPLYICRNEGEREIAFLATKEKTLDEALAVISELIEGKPSPVETTRRFFDFNTADRSKDLKSVFFSLRPEGGGGGGGGKRHFFSFYLCDRAAEDEQVEKNRIKIRPCIPEILHAKV